MNGQYILILYTYF